MAELLDEEQPAGVQPSPESTTASSVGVFDPKPDESPDERTRRGVSYWLLVLLSAVIAASFLAMFLTNANGDNSVADAAADSDRMLKLVNIVFGPVVTLVSSVVGFYFGARTAQESSNG